MARSGSDLTRWGAVGLMGAALLLAGCSDDAAQEASEPGVVLSSPEALATAIPSDQATPDDNPGSDDDPSSRDDDHADDPGDDDHAEDPADDDVVLRGAPTFRDDTAELDVEDQRGDGRTVRVEEVRFSSGTGIVGIYDAGLKLLGSSVVSSGDHAVTIELDRRLGSSQELFAVLHRDDGDGVLGSGDAVFVDEGEQVGEDFDYLLD